MSLNRWFACATVCVASVVSHAALAADAKDALSDAGLTKAGDVYVLPDEGPVIEGMKELRATKVQADKEGKQRKVIENQLATKKKTMKDADKEWHELETRLSVVTDVGIHNRMVTRMNRLLADHKQAMADDKELEEQVGKVSMTGKAKFVDDMAALGPKADAVAEKYKALAADPAVTAALAKARTAAGPAGAKLALGPSPAFAAVAADLKKWRSEVDSEAIPLRDDEGGGHTVDVLINGEHLQMSVDTGASAITVTGEVAETLKIVPGPNDPVIQLQLADGNLIEGHEMTVKTVRVGRFTLEDVRCVVLNKGLTHAPLLLGGSFLNHFIVKLDPAAHELQLTEIKGEGQVKTAPASPKASGSPKS